MIHAPIYIGLLSCLICLPPLKQWISLHVQGTAFLLTGNMTLARLSFWLVFLPGIFLHEFSHWLIARLLWVKTAHFSLRPEIRPDGWMQLGAVYMAQPIDPFRHSLIGLAPFIIGSLAILIVGQGLLNMAHLPLIIQQGDLTAFTTYLITLGAKPRTWLGLYLIFVISNTMFPSDTDRQAWLTALIYSGFMLIIVLAFGVTATLISTIQNIGLVVVSSLLMAFSLIVMVDILFVGVIMSIETLFSWIMGRQVIYNR